MDRTVDARMHANIGDIAAREGGHDGADSEEGEAIDKFETANKGFGDVVHHINSNVIKVKQYMPPQPSVLKMTQKRQTEEINNTSTTTGFAKYEESAGDLASVKDRITIYDETDRFKLRELS